MPLSTTNEPSTGTSVMPPYAFRSPDPEISTKKTPSLEGRPQASKSKAHIQPRPTGKIGPGGEQNPLILELPMNQEAAESGCQTDLRARVRRKIVHKHGFTANNLSIIAMKSATIFRKNRP